MSQVIISPNPYYPGSVSLTTPVDGTDLQKVIHTALPAGTPYLIVDEADLPPDDGYWFGAWEADFSVPDGTSIGPDAWYQQNPEVEE